MPSTAGITLNLKGTKWSRFHVLGSGFVDRPKPSVAIGRDAHHPTYAWDCKTKYESPTLLTVAAKFIGTAIEGRVRGEAGNIDIIVTNNGVNETIPNVSIAYVNEDDPSEKKDNK